jgi:hypothetical protein
MNIRLLATCTSLWSLALAIVAFVINYHVSDKIAGSFHVLYVLHDNGYHELAKTAVAQKWLLGQTVFTVFACIGCVVLEYKYRCLKHTK